MNGVNGYHSSAESDLESQKPFVSKLDTHIKASFDSARDDDNAEWSSSASPTQLTANGPIKARMPFSRQISSNSIQDTPNVRSRADSKAATPNNRLPSYSKRKNKNSFSLATRRATDQKLAAAQEWPILILRRILNYKPAKYSLLLLLAFTAIYGLSHKWHKRKPTLKPKLFSQDPRLVGAARREAQLRLTNPETIPYADLFSLPSSIDALDPAITISVLFIPLQHATQADIERGISLFKSQSKQPSSFHLFPSLTPYTLSQTEHANTTMPSPNESQLTFILPLLGRHIKEIGPHLIRQLIRLSGTREFSGAYLEVGCGQAALVQTAWLDKLNLGTDNEVSDQISWHRRGLSAIRVPLQDQSAGKEGFWVNGLKECEREGELTSSKNNAAKANIGSIKFLVEASTRWERAWQDLICEFVNRKTTWSAEVVFFYERGSTDLGCRQINRKSGAEIIVHTASIHHVEQWEADLATNDVVIFVKDGAVSKILNGKNQPKHTYTAIELPEADLGSAVWIAALEVDSLKAWHIPRMDLTVITNNRPESLDRLLSSMESAHYFGDSVHLTISMEQTTDFATQNLLSSFSWPFGSYQLRRRIILGGLMPAIVESWYPATNDSYGVFLEDDVEVSPLFYAWLKFSILRYRYDDEQKRLANRLFGVSLYQPKNVELRPEGRQPFDAHILFEELSLPLDTPYLSQVPCSWGAAYFPEIWREYHEYLAIRLSEVALEIGDVVVPDVRSNRWPRSWKKYFNELVYLRGYTMLYPNYPNFESFSTNHLERGTHVKEALVDLKKKMQFEVPLMPDANPSLLLDLPDATLPVWNNMPVLDLWGAVATEEEIIARGWSTVVTLATCAGALETQPYNLSRPPTYNPKELLCAREYTRELNLTSWGEEFDEAPEQITMPIGN